MPKVVFVQGEKKTVCEVAVGQSLLEAAQDNGLNMLNACGGMGVCTTCMVEVKKNPENLSAITESEQVMGFENSSPHRLGCQACVQGEVEVEMN